MSCFCLIDTTNEVRTGTDSQVKSTAISRSTKRLAFGK